MVRRRYAQRSVFEVLLPGRPGTPADVVLRMLTRRLKRLQTHVGRSVITVRDRTRAMGKLVFQLAHKRKSESVEGKKAQLQKLYRGVLRITVAVVGEAKKAVAAVRGRPSKPTEFGKLVKI